MKQFGTTSETEHRSYIPTLQDRKTRCSITITGISPHEVYTFWRALENLPRFMDGIERVDVLSERRSRWVAQPKAGLQPEWEAEITQDLPGRMIAWESVEGSVDTTGEVWFSEASGQRGTVVSLSMDYAVPGGKLTELAAMLIGQDPETVTRKNLHRLKAYLETGEIPTIQGQPNGRNEIDDGSSMLH